MNERSEITPVSTDERGDSPCHCPDFFWGRPDCQESNPPATYCKWERQCEEQAAREREANKEAE